jgi:excisionase family DNA binding protein
MDVAELLGCHFRTVHRLIHDQELRAIKFGREFRILRQDYEAYLFTHGTKPAQGPGSAKTKDAATSTDSSPRRVR